MGWWWGYDSRIMSSQYTFPPLQNKFFWIPTEVRGTHSCDFKLSFHVLEKGFVVKNTDALCWLNLFVLLNKMSVQYFIWFNKVTAIFPHIYWATADILLETNLSSTVRSITFGILTQLSCLWLLTPQVSNSGGESQRPATLWLWLRVLRLDLGLHRKAQSANLYANFLSPLLDYIIRSKKDKNMPPFYHSEGQYCFKWIWASEQSPIF